MERGTGATERARLARPSVHVMDHFKIARVILEGATGRQGSEFAADRPCRAVGLEVAVVDPETGNARSRKRLLLRKVSAEVVLCAGALETPKILMLSGLGPRDELAALGIECHVHSPHVGRNLQVGARACLPEPLAASISLYAALT